MEGDHAATVGGVRRLREAAARLRWRGRDFKLPLELEGCGHVLHPIVVSLPVDGPSSRGEQKGEEDDGAGF